MTDETERNEEAQTESTEAATTTDEADDGDLIESIVEVAKAPFEWLLGRGIGNED